MRRRTLIVVSAAALVVLAACSGAPDPGAATTTLPPPTSSSAPATTTTTGSSTTAGSSTTMGTTTSSTSTTTLPPLQGLGLEVVADGLSRPLFVTAPPGDDRVFIVERTATVRMVVAGVMADSPYLDLRDRVGSSGIEQGLLGMAFHPDFASNGRLFVYYTDKNDDSVLAEFTADPETGEVDPATERVVLTLDQPTNRHNAGMLLFGPEGHLYLSLGEGGANQRNAQDPSNWFGSILRIDVGPREGYAIPDDNPYAGGGGAPEVWSFGLRNPWRFAIDPVEGLMYIADVGHAEWEEIDVVPLAGAPYNFGWPNVEGAHCFFESGCDPADYVLPAVEYGHGGGDCSVTGGFVYRGAAIPELTGHYFYADWCGQWVRSFRYSDGEVIEVTDWTEDLGDVGQVNSFGTDAAGELYLATWDGRVMRIVPER